MKELRWDLTRAQIVWLQQIRSQNGGKGEYSDRMNAIVDRSDDDEDQKVRLNVLRGTYINYKKAELI